MTATGYHGSGWPTECGGPQRRKLSPWPGPGYAAGDTPRVWTRTTGLWNVMFVWRDDALYLQGTTTARHPGAFGWVERVDPETLEPIDRSPDLPCGGHRWCGAILVHRDGGVFSINGNHLHRLDPACSLEAELRLPVDQTHNGFLALSDGTIAAKDLQLVEASTITAVDPTSVEVVATMRLPEASMGRIAGDIDGDGDVIYVPGREHIWRVRWDGERFHLDEAWQYRYRDDATGTHGLAWDSCLSGGHLWSMDCGDIASVREIFSVRPNGTFGPSFDLARLSWQRPAPWSGAQRLHRVSTGDVTDADVVELSGAAGGGIIAPPVYVDSHRMAVAWDSLRGGIGGWRFDGAGLERLWWRPGIRPTMQPLVFDDTGELVVNDATPDGDHLVVIDVATGESSVRVDVGSRLANGMFLTPGRDGSVYYASTLTVARVAPA